MVDIMLCIFGNNISRSGVYSFSLFHISMAQSINSTVNGYKSVPVC